MPDAEADLNSLRRLCDLAGVPVLDEDLAHLAEALQSYRSAMAGLRGLDGELYCEPLVEWT
jgi:hypothetical protein